MKEKEHGMYFLNLIAGHSWLPFFEYFFKWGLQEKLNNVDPDNEPDLSDSDILCK